MIGDALFAGWTGVARAVIVAALGYAGLVLFLRIAGKRALAKLNAFDWAVTVALGSTLATTALSRSVALTEGLAVFATLILGQYVVTWLSLKSATFRNAVRAEPAVLYRDGSFDREAMSRERVTESEIRQAVRASGGQNMSDALIVLLQTEGSLAAVLRR